MAADQRPDPDPRLADGMAKYNEQTRGLMGETGPIRPWPGRLGRRGGPDAASLLRDLTGLAGTPVDAELDARRDEQDAVRRNDHATASQAHRRRWDALAAEMGEAPLTVPLVGSQELATFAGAVSDPSGKESGPGCPDRRASTDPAGQIGKSYVFLVLNGSGWREPCYWRPNEAGYTSDIVHAGLYQAGRYPPAQRGPDGQLLGMDPREHHSCELDAIPRIEAEISALQARLAQLQDLLRQAGG